MKVKSYYNHPGHLKGKSVSFSGTTCELPRGASTYKYIKFTYINFI